MKLAALGLIALASVPAHAADQFDLQCSGTEHVMEIETLTNDTKPYSAEFRIDLAAKQYCINACERGPSPIAEVSEGSIAFEKSVASDPIYGTKGFAIDRTNGKLAEYSFPADHSLSLDIKADCTVAPFKGFPKVATKF